MRDRCRRSLRRAGPLMGALRSQRLVPRSRARAVSALVVALLGAGVLVGTGTAATIQTAQAAERRAVGTFELVPLEERDIDVSAHMNPNPSITTADERRLNAFGTPVYDANTDPALVTYPGSLTAQQRTVQELRVARNFVAAQCMADLGLDFTFSLPWERTDSQRRSNSIDLPAVGTPEWKAYVGTRFAGEAYNWKDAGCGGYAEHLLASGGNNHSN